MDELVLDAHVRWVQYAQPVVERSCQKLIPDILLPVANPFLATVAQIYLEDQGTNYAIRQGRETTLICAGELDSIQNALP